MWLEWVLVALVIAGSGGYVAGRLTPRQRIQWQRIERPSPTRMVVRRAIEQRPDGHVTAVEEIEHNGLPSLTRKGGEQ